MFSLVVVLSAKTRPLRLRARERTKEKVSTPKDRGPGQHRWPQSSVEIFNAAFVKASICVAFQLNISAPGSFVSHGCAQKLRNNML